MARNAVLLALACALALAVGAQAQGKGWVCSVTVRFDNTATELEKQMPKIKKELGDEVCDLPDGLLGMSVTEWAKVVVGPTSIKDDSWALDSNTQATLHCMGTNKDKAAADKACYNCMKYIGKGAGNFGDELEDSTSFPEIEVEKVLNCVVEQVELPVKIMTAAAAAAAKKAAAAPKAPAAAPKTTTTMGAPAAMKP